MMVYPERAGPFFVLRRAGDEMIGDESAMRFVCYRCLRIRRWTMGVLFGVLVVVVVVVLVAARMGRL
jgi:hypothetical protein